MNSQLCGVHIGTIALFKVVKQALMNDRFMGLSIQEAHCITNTNGTYGNAVQCTASGVYQSIYITCNVVPVNHLTVSCLSDLHFHAIQGRFQTIVVALIIR